MLEKCVKDNHYASFILTAIAAAQRNALFSSLDIKFGQSQWSMKGRSGAPGHGVCSKSVSSTIMLQGSVLPAILQRNALFF